MPAWGDLFRDYLSSEAILKLTQAPWVQSVFMTSWWEHLRWETQKLQPVLLSIKRLTTIWLQETWRSCLIKLEQNGSKNTRKTVPKWISELRRSLGGRQPRRGIRYTPLGRQTIKSKTKVGWFGLFLQFHYSMDYRVRAGAIKVMSLSLTAQPTMHRWSALCLAILWETPCLSTFEVAWLGIPIL